MKNTLLLNERLDDFWIYPKLSKVSDIRQDQNGFFDFLNQNKTSNPELNLYVHIPFCSSRCMFCPYYKMPRKFNSPSMIKEYLETVILEMKKYANTMYFCNQKISSIHFGGGDPLLLGLDNFKWLLSEIKKIFITEENVSCSLEGSLSSISSKEYVSELYKLGIERMSFGIQTFNPNIRKHMNINTTLDQIYRAVDNIQEAGFKEYCFDMMYNLPNQSDENLIDDLEKVTELNPYHIDVYNMAIFPNTYLDKLIKTSKEIQIKPTNENQIRMYKVAHKWLLNNEYKQIISHTYSRIQEKPHTGDQLYLLNNNVLGIGASSRGYLDGYAYKNVCNIKEYSDEIAKGNFPANLTTYLDKEEQEDRLMVFFPICLKMEIDSVPSIRYKEKLDNLLEMNLIKKNDNMYELTDEGMLWSGNISAHFIGEKRWNSYLNSFLQSLRDKTNPYNEDDMGIYLSGNE